MQAQFSAYPPDHAVIIRLLDAGRIYRVGRATECELCIDHFSVSRFHAEIQFTENQWRIADTGSRNGLRAGGHLVLQAGLDGPTWFAIGDVYCWFEPLSQNEAASFQAHLQGRRVTSQSLVQQLRRASDIETLLRQTLQAALELSGMERGFVVYRGDDAVLRVRVCQGIGPTELARPNFGGSAGAVERCLESRRSVICCDTSDSPWLGARPSVQFGGIRAIACVPLTINTECLGAIYVDSRRAGPLLTELDLELFENLAQQAAATLAAARLRGAVDAVLQAAGDAGVPAPRWDDVRSAR
ncbi:GAF domain-containing protein [Tahibacter amnicola]|uniref:GAF domain-containing protein n=1 Tax=Tahibacter amnicola TaxID=2976241 RepID=A0ABY6BCF4_9GAMM|nr:GAF domain-containing protein [Tahibacter amnicola]UXI67544.1 GAF domain-containing protein [Tahibacter amnicola]